MIAFSYNNIEFYDIGTCSILRYPVFNDKKEYMWTDFVLNVNGIYIVSETDTEIIIQERLLQPRRHLRLRKKGSISVDPEPPFIINMNEKKPIDLDNGPLPIKCNITRINKTIVHIDYIIKTSLIDG